MAMVLCSGAVIAEEQKKSSGSEQKVGSQIELQTGLSNAGFQTTFGTTAKSADAPTAGSSGWQHGLSESVSSAFSGKITTQASGQASTSSSTSPSTSAATTTVHSTTTPSRTLTSGGRDTGVVTPTSSLASKETPVSGSKSTVTTADSTPAVGTSNVSATPAPPADSPTPNTASPK